ncbi:unnamed protein product [Lepeophtheirus salmonis]|uniref:(salmon louse) hypothetical protein n=1 Tax=Lepeophtheirus salmonis TaxID=72036 RepID=A0A7R8H875_LEPSM|nr:unnamed protein product [Lepeophtheirus salmonis]CAF2925018.1 unnamed protein product [Lepeophtheirus salmonis]
MKRVGTSKSPKTEKAVFYGLPVQFGDWVPLNQAQDTIKSVANSFFSNGDRRTRIDAPRGGHRRDRKIFGGRTQNFSPFQTHFQQQGGGGHKRKDPEPEIITLRPDSNFEEPINNFKIVVSPNKPFVPPQTASIITGETATNILPPPIIKTLKAPDLTKEKPSLILEEELEELNSNNRDFIIKHPQSGLIITPSPDQWKATGTQVTANENPFQTTHNKQPQIITASSNQIRGVQNRGDTKVFLRDEDDEIREELSNPFLRNVQNSQEIIVDGDSVVHFTINKKEPKSLNYETSGKVHHIHQGQRPKNEQIQNNQAHQHINERAQNQIISQEHIIHHEHEQHQRQRTSSEHRPVHEHPNNIQTHYTINEQRQPEIRVVVNEQKIIHQPQDQGNQQEEYKIVNEHKSFHNIQEHNKEEQRLPQVHTVVQEQRIIHNPQNQRNHHQGQRVHNEYKSSFQTHHNNQEQHVANENKLSQNIQNTKNHQIVNENIQNAQNPRIVREHSQYAQNHQIVNENIENPLIVREHSQYAQNHPVLKEQKLSHNTRNDQQHYVQNSRQHHVVNEQNLAQNIQHSQQHHVVNVPNLAQNIQNAQEYNRIMNEQKLSQGIQNAEEHHRAVNEQKLPQNVQNVQTETVNPSQQQSVNTSPQYFDSQNFRNTQQQRFQNNQARDQNNLHTRQRFQSYTNIKGIHTPKDLRSFAEHLRQKIQAQRNQEQLNIQKSLNQRNSEEQNIQNSQDQRNQQELNLQNSPDQRNQQDKIFNMSKMKDKPLEIFRITTLTSRFMPKNLSGSNPVHPSSTLVFILNKVSHSKVFPVLVDDSKSLSLTNNVLTTSQNLKRPEPSLVSVQSGQSQLNVPFIDVHNEDPSLLPSVFVAPLGFDIPHGFAGHPLPYDPLVKDDNYIRHQYVSRSPILHTTTRPSLETFYRNKAKNTESYEAKKRQKKRILTKIVRKPINFNRQYFSSQAAKFQRLANPNGEQTTTLTTVTFPSLSTPTISLPVTSANTEESLFRNSDKTYSVVSNNGQEIRKQDSLFEEESLAKFGCVKAQKEKKCGSQFRIEIIEISFTQPPLPQLQHHQQQQHTESTQDSQQNERPSTLNKFKFRKFNYNGNNQRQSNSEGTGYGQRLRARKRPTFWALQVSTESLYNHHRYNEADSYKKRYRPFFDTLYDNLNDQPSQKPSTSYIRPRNIWSKKRRPTSSPFNPTIAAEIYEVHPKSRARISQRTSTTATTTSEVPLLPRRDIFVSDIPSTTGSAAFIEKESTTLSASLFDFSRLPLYPSNVHEIKTEELAAPHTTLPSAVQEINSNGLINGDELQFGESQKVQTLWNDVSSVTHKNSEEVNDSVYDTYPKDTLFQQDNQNYDVDNHESQEIVDEVEGFENNYSSLVLTESEPNVVVFKNVHDDSLIAEVQDGSEGSLNQGSRIINAFPQIELGIEEEVSTKTPTNQRLSSYKKPISLVDELAERHDSQSSYVTENIINEHSQQNHNTHHFEISNSDWTPIPSYVEIVRTEAPSNKKLEESSIITKEDIVKHGGIFNIPVSFSLEGSKSTDTTQEKEGSTTELFAAETITAIPEPTTTEKLIIEAATHYVPTTKLAETTTSEYTETTSPPITTPEEPPSTTTTAKHVITTTVIPQQDTTTLEEVSSTTEIRLQSETTLSPETTINNLDHITADSTPSIKNAETTTGQYESFDDYNPTTAGFTELNKNYQEVEIEERQNVITETLNQGFSSLDETTESLSTVRTTDQGQQTTTVASAFETTTINITPDNFKEELTTTTEVPPPEISTQPEIAHTGVFREAIVHHIPLETTLITATVTSTTTPTTTTTTTEAPLTTPDPALLFKSIYNNAQPKAIFGFEPSSKKVAFRPNWIRRKYQNRYKSPSARPLEYQSLPFAPTVIPFRFPSQSESIAPLVITSPADLPAPNQENLFAGQYPSENNELGSVPDYSPSKSKFYEKFSHQRVKNNFFNSVNNISKEKPRYPKGSDPKVFKNWGGNSLSQAEFERSILGVSTATEVSVQSRICIRGKCFDANEDTSNYFRKK